MMIKIYKPMFIVPSAYIITFLLFFFGLFINPFYFQEKYLYSLIASAILGIPAHEIVHYIAARLMKVEGLGFHFTIHGIVLKYREMKGKACIITSISPLLFFFSLMIISRALEYDFGVHIFILSWVAFSSSGFDVLSFLIFLLVGGKKTYPIYGIEGKIVGGIIENKHLYVLLVKNVNEDYIRYYIKKIKKI